MEEIKCAVYTRKSTDEGLEKEFNTLEAQREAGENYVKSQKHQGWVLIKEHYDDGGFSGGNMNRPSLKRLLQDVEAGKVNMIVVYKIDRLTRSLTDFAKMVDVFDKYHCSFVSVTQNFNTADSMGRLTLNMLLSFAQFEREISGERIRDKVAASKKKGIWMGGCVPYGYEPIKRKLVIKPEEAKVIKFMFEKYLEYKRNGSLSGPYVVTPGALTTEVILSEEPDIDILTGIDAERTHFVFGTSDKWSVLARVTGIYPRSTKVEITAVIEDSRVHQ